MAQAEKLTTRAENFSDWYVELIRRSKLADYSEVKGCMVIRPHGYAIWETIQSVLDKMFKETGHQNAYFPMLIPESYMRREAEHVEGFSPQLAVVTHAGGSKLEEPLVLRPTSETIINANFARWIQSHRDLPILLNQWANVVRWEMRTRLFLRTSEFLWQEGHTCHATENEAEEETLRMLDVYRRLAEEWMAMPVLCGQKTDSEKFAGAVRTYSIEALMQDKKALQAGTSHNLGQNFAKAFGTQYQGKDGQQHHVFQTSWGVSTRLIGALVMTHSDDKGLVLPPRLSPVQVVLIPIGKKADFALSAEACKNIHAELLQRGIRSRLDEDESTSPGFKFHEWEMMGACLRIELGPKDLAKQQCVLARRDSGEKQVVGLDGIAERVAEELSAMQRDMFARAQGFVRENTFVVNSWEEMREKADAGFLLAHWDGDAATEAEIKQALGLTTRNRPFNLPREEGVCIKTGRPSTGRMVFCKAY
jgi:prolyl-tRNA synthetase